MKRSLPLAALLLLAVSCGGRRNTTEEPGLFSPQDSVVRAFEERQHRARTDTAGLRKVVASLPEEPYFDIVTSQGTIRVKLFKDTPKHRDNFIRLAQAHFYDDVLFHRVINGFVIQGGDPFTRDTSRVEEWGEGGPGYNLPAEIVPEHLHKKGALAAARRGNVANPLKESSGSQFYLVQDPANCTHLDGEYTVFGETVGGFNVIDRIAGVATDRFDRPVQPVVIKEIRPNEEMNRNALIEGVPALEGFSMADAPAIEVQGKIRTDETPGKKAEEKNVMRPTTRRNSPNVRNRDTTRRSRPPRPRSTRKEKSIDTTPK